MSPRKYPKHKPPILPDGGSQLILQCLGLSMPLVINDAEHSLDVVFVSIDFEVSRYEINKPGPPLVKEFGIAVLDTRRLNVTSPLSKASSITCLETGTIITKQFSTSHSSEDFVSCDVTDFRECIFAETFHVTQENLATTIKDCLMIQDMNFADKTVWRDVVLIGHSPKHDLQVIQRLGVDISSLVKVIGVVDTHLIARSIVRAEVISENATALVVTNFTLGAILTGLAIPHNKFDLHNAANDATLTLHAVLTFAVRSCNNQNLGNREKENLRQSRQLIQWELYERQHWVPKRTALGFFA